jgi:hypothetical protein
LVGGPGFGQNLRMAGKNCAQRQGKTRHRKGFPLDLQRKILGMVFATYVSKAVGLAYWNWPGSIEFSSGQLRYFSGG